MNPKWKYVKGGSGLMFVALFLAVLLNPVILFIIICFASLILYGESENMSKEKKTKFIAVVAVMVLLFFWRLSCYKKYDDPWDKGFRDDPGRRMRMYDKW